ncbi:MAG: TIGR00269 family protein [Candidatus Hydrothermarchaeota archaeon]|nr:TIGR00269 family protein [Candidatus Hydrothermarchaeota archaeon]
MSVCDNCNDRMAIYFRRYSGQRFCGEHFLQYFENKVRKTIQKYKMIERGDRLGVAVSGGKDSITTLSILNELAKKNLEICAIAVDEGIKGYRSSTIKSARSFCSEQNIPLHIVSFRKRFGATLDKIMRQEKENACTYCGVLRRRLLSEKARELSLDKLATGHNLDDEVQAIMMNYIRGDIGRLLRLGRSVLNKKFIPRIKPLSEMPEKEVALYALLRDFEVSFVECPYSLGTFRAGIRDFINELEKNNAGIKFSILKGYQKLLPYLELKAAMHECKICGEPTSQKICKTCLLVKMFI